MSYRIYQSEGPFQLESGHILPGYHLAYNTFGSLNAAKDNVVWIFHALTANSDPTEWWPGLVGQGRFFDPAQYFIICVNMPGSCYGSLGPLDVNPETGQPYYHRFPFFTPRDMIRSFQPLKDALGIHQIKIGIGGSMGGQQLLEWAIEEPNLFEYIFPLATNAQHSAWGIAYNSSQRLSIEADESWKNNDRSAGLNGMKAARSIALISYRHYETYHASQSEQENEKIEHFKSDSYQRYQGEKLGKRFNAFSYYFLSKGMDAHNVGRGRQGVAAALERISAHTLAIGIGTDMLFPVQEQQFIADAVPRGKFISIQSLYGHDGFLLEAEQIQRILGEFLPKAKPVSVAKK